MFFFFFYCFCLLLSSHLFLFPSSLSNTLPQSSLSVSISLSSSQSLFTGRFPSSFLSVTVHYFLSFTPSLSIYRSLFHFLPLECVNAFALVVRPPTEQENLLFSFQLAGEETVKSTWLRTLCRHVANTICRADAVSHHTLTYTHSKESR